MSHRTSVILWAFTALFIVALSVVTIDLAIDARAQPVTGVEVTLAGPSQLIYLRAQPNRVARIVAVLDRGAQATILSGENRNDQVWFQVKTSAGSGWVESTSIQLAAP